MEFIKRRLIACVMLMTIGMAALPVHAEEINDDQINDRPTGLAMAGDVLIARPMLLVGTVLGNGMFLVSLPFTALGGNVKEAAHTLVLGPAHATFMRCLGCTEKEDEYKNKSTVVNDNSTASAQ